MIKIILVYTIFLMGFSMNGQTINSLKVVSIDGKGLDDVSVYVENALIGKTDLDGTLDLEHTIPVKIILIKAGFEERSVTLHEDENEIVLYEIGIRDLGAVEIVKLDMYNEFKQLLARTKAANLIYVYKADNAIYNKLTSGNDILHYLNNKVYYIPNKGLHIENKSDVVAHFKSLKSADNSVSNLYELNGVKIELSSLFTARPISMLFIPSFVALNNDLKEYDVFFSKKGDTLRADFEPKKQSKKMRYTGHITYNQSDYGIYEMEFTSSGSRKYDSYINSVGKTKVSFRDFNEYLFIANTRKEDGLYYAKGAEYSLNTEILNTTAKGRILKQDYRVSPIELIQPTTKIKFDLSTYDFD